MRLQRGLFSLATAAVVGMGTAGCEEAFGPGSDERDVSLSFEVAGTASGLSSSLGVGSAVGTLTLDSAQIVLARVKLHRAGDNKECAEDRDVNCQSFTAGPVLVSLPLKGGRITPFVTRPTPGTYDRLEFKIHRPEGNDSLTRAFRAKYPSWPANAAIRVVGKYDGQPFDLFFRSEAHIRQEFDPALAISDTTNLGALGLTVSVDVAQWFQGEGATLDPRALTASPRFLALVERNIRESFRTRHARGKSKENRENGNDKKDD